MDRKSGVLMAIGGHEDKDENAEVLGHFVALAGGKKARIVVLAAASTQKAAMKQDYENAFQALGVAEVRTLPLNHRDECYAEEVVAAVQGATGIMMTGGEQYRLMSTVGGTPIETAMKEGFRERGVVVAGTSAGGAALSSHMVLETIAEDSARVEKGMLNLGVGLGFLDHILIDTHFAQRGRVYRLLATVAANPAILGVGIDENTALVIDPGREIRVIGAGGITVLDAKNIRHSNLNEISSGELISLTDGRIHILSSGLRCDVTGASNLESVEQDSWLAALVATLSHSSILKD